MQRIAIIGNAGGGKSRLARQLGAALDLPVREIDLLQWQPGWERTPPDEINSVHAGWLAESAWIIDGWGDWEALRRRFDRADKIILLDLPLWLHYWWATKRQVLAAMGRSEGWPPPGCLALPITWRLYKLMWRIHWQTRPELLALVEEYRGAGKVVHLRSVNEINAFLQEI